MTLRLMTALFTVMAINLYLHKVTEDALIKDLSGWAAIITAIILVTIYILDMTNKDLFDTLETLRKGPFH